MDKADTLINLNNGFHLMFQQAAAMSGDGNFLLAPISIIYAVAVLMTGMTGESRNQCSAILGFDFESVLPDPLLLEMQDLASNNMDIANSLWTTESCPINPSFINTASSRFDAFVKSVDFSSPDTLNMINTWVGEKTKGLIPRLLDSISKETSMIILNAVYFKGTWKNQFQKERTFKAAFNSQNGEIEMTNFMHKTDSHRYFSDEEVDYLTFEYKNSSIVLVTALPQQRNVDPLRVVKVKGLLEAATSDKRDRFSVSLPKFEIDSKTALKNVFENLGVNGIFSNSQDFADIFSATPSAVSSIVHQAKIVVDEEGTEAAAATAIMMTKSVSINQNFYILDHPFTFHLIDSKSGIILFSGVYRNP